ncbi:MAG: glycosyltransferase family 39 protein [Nitrososphaera sp.]
MIVRDIHHRRNIAILMSLVVISGLATALYMYSIDRYALVYYGDAGSHLIASRKLFDWKENPGWDQIGTVWLPLPHFLLMFPSLADVLFFSGFAGLAISLPSLALTSIFLYKMVERVLSKIPNIDARLIPYAALAGALLYALNPNFMYLGITAMTEAPFMLFFVGSAFYLLRWIEEYKCNPRSSLKYLLVCAAFVSAATLCRYEGWILPIFLIASVAITILHKRRERTASGLTVLSAAAIVVISLSGIIFWLAFNEVKYGDPLEFANAQYYSAASQALNRPVRENLFLQPYNVISVYGVTAVMVYGPVLLAAAGFVYLMHRRTIGGAGETRHLLAFLAAAPVFTIVSMLIGIGEMTLWFNSRFVVLLAPLLIVLAGIYISKQPKTIVNTRLLLAGVIAALFAFLPVILAFGAVVTLADAEGGFGYRETPFAIQTGEKLGSIYDGTGSIVIITGSAQEHRIMVASGIPLRNFDSIIESSTWKQSFREPWQFDNTLMVISKEPDSDGVEPAKYWSENRGELDLYYHTIYENQYYEILART